MTRRLTTEEAKWLVDNCLPAHSVSAPPAWPPGGFFRRLLGGSMRDNGQLETAYLMLVPGKQLCLKVKERESIPKHFTQTVYHGTSLGALEQIMGTGFRPSLGAGADEAGKKYNCSLPMVYTSGLLETAHGYVGDVETGQRIGSGQHLGPMVNCVIWMKADPEKRLFRKKPVRNKSGQLRNEQQGYHPKDLTITRIYLHCVEAGFITPERAKYGNAEPSGKDLRRLNADLRAAAALLFDEDQAPWWKAPPKLVQKKKEGITAGLSKGNRKVLQRWRKERRGEQPASGSGSALPPPPPLGVASKSAPASGREHDDHVERAIQRLASMEETERARLETLASKKETNRGMPSVPPVDPSNPDAPLPIAALAPPPPRAPPPAAHDPQRSRSPRQRRGDTRRLCVNGCGRAAAAGYTACCRTCTNTGGVAHGPRCAAAWRLVNEPPPPWAHLR